MNQNFVQIGYFIDNEYAEPFEPENYPNPVNIDLLRRVICAEDARVTRYAIDWTGENPVAPHVPVEHAPASTPVAGQSNQMADFIEDDLEGGYNDEEDEDSEEEEEEEEEGDDGDVDIDLEEDDEEGGSMDEGDDEGDGAATAGDENYTNGNVMLCEDSMDVGAMGAHFDRSNHSHSSFNDI